MALAKTTLDKSSYICHNSKSIIFLMKLNRMAVILHLLTFLFCGLHYTWTSSEKIKSQEHTNQCLNHSDWITGCKCIW